MGYIKEPEGIDFIINGKPLTDEEDSTIREYFKAQKAKRNETLVVQKQKSKKKQIA
jgi:hypothetical protein